MYWIDYQSFITRNTSSSTASNLSYDSNITSQILGSGNGSTGPTGSFNTSQIIDAICEGPIQGWPVPGDPLKFVYLDGTPVKSYNSTINTGNLRFEFKNGAGNQTPLSNYTVIGSAKAPQWQAEIDDINKGGGSGSIIQQVQIRDDSDGAYPIVEAVAFTFTFPEGIFRYKTSGGRSTTPIGIRIEVNPKANGSGTWIKRIETYRELEVTSGGFDWTFIVELPPGWATPSPIQNYASPALTVDDIIQFRISKYNTDYTNDRAHSKVFLKSFTIYTRNQYSYPYTALTGLTIDSKNFDGSIPKRNYELKLLKVKVPSNYSIETDPKTGLIKERNYSGQWDGTFKEGYWTDNPVWCFYDLVTNSRYGLGKYIDSSLLNKWRLYEIAKYCDAVVADTRPTYPNSGLSVPANSYTYSELSGLGGVPAAAGTSGASVIKEPRFTCNVFISSREEAFSVVQRMASLFRAITFFQSGTLEVIQDRPATPTYLYNNTNVIDGIFSYSSSGAKARHTVAIVKWIDPDDLYSEKLEYVEDYDGIARYGYREIEIDGFGCTSRGQARRLGRHILITEKFELETISFRVGMEGGTVTPGSLIKIKDSYRQTYRAAGRIVSATSSSITIDNPIKVPTNASPVALWIQTSSARNEVIDTNSTAILKPRLDSYSITVPAFSPGVSILSPTVAISPIPVAGNIWGLSYTEPGDVENTSVYKVLSVVENGPFEYEITALQHYSAKYDEIEQYAPIPAYRPNPLKLFIPPPSEGFISSKFNGSTHDLTVTWRSDRYISGTKYKVEIISSNESRVLTTGTTDTTYTYPNASSGTYYFRVYTLSSVSSETSTPLLIGPFKVKEVMPQNNFDAFNQTQFSSDYITNTWPDDVFPNDPIKYELWRAPSNNLRTLAVSPVRSIQSIDYATNKITLTGFDQTSIASPDLYSAEVSILPYTRYKAVDVNLNGFSPATSPGRIVLDTSERPSISVGDKIVNSTRSTTTNVAAITQSLSIQNRWVSRITVAPAVTSQAAGDLLYSFKGVMGVSLNETRPSGVIKQKTFRLDSPSSTTTLRVVSPDTFENVLVGDIMVNRTRRIASVVSTIVSPLAITVSPAITGQVAGDTIAYYQASVREARKLNDYSIDWLNVAYGGDAINVLDYDDSTSIPESNNSIMANISKGYCAEVIDSSLNPGGVLKIVTYPNGMSPAISDGDLVVFFRKNEVYTSSVATHIHPTAAVAAVGTSPGGVTATGLFTTAKTGDIVVNATRNNSGVILSKISNNQVTLAGSGIANLAITGQTTGDVVFVVPGSTMTSFVEDLSYTHPTVYTTTTGTTTSTAIVSPSIFTPSPTTSYLLYNMTRNAYASVSPNTATRVTVSPAITGQTVGDSIFLFLPANITTTTVTAPDGAFNYARPGDIFYNVTRDTMATIKDVVSLTGLLDKKLDRLVLSTPIAGQTAGDEFRIIQGFFNAAIKSKQDNGTNDILELETVVNLEVGDEVRIYQYNATKVGTTAGNTITDTGLNFSTTYYYWMRPVSARFPFIGGIWKPSRTTGDSATTTAISQGNYDSSNDNNGSPIIPDAVTPIAPFIDLPPGGRNPDSTANIRLYWEWTGKPASIDGFSIYFWSSNSTTDVGSPVGDDNSDYVRATTGYTALVNPRITIASISPGNPNASSTTITTTIPHNISNGDKIRITAASPMANINNVTHGSFYTASGVTSNTLIVSPVSTPTGTYTANTGTVTSCEYVYQINNLTANYYYNAWIQPYRMVNTNTSENGVILGSPKKLY